MKIDAILTDFDGTLVNTFKANYIAYKLALSDFNIELSEDYYKSVFGLRFDDFMTSLNITKNLWDDIKLRKSLYYKENLNLLELNTELYNFIKYSHDVLGISTVIATTASKINIINAIKYLNIDKAFDYIITGEDVKCGKPNPEVYIKAMKYIKATPENTLIFEDSDVGIQAAINSGANYIKIIL